MEEWDGCSDDDRLHQSRPLSHSARHSVLSEPATRMPTSPGAAGGASPRKKLPAMRDITCNPPRNSPGASKQESYYIPHSPVAAASEYDKYTRDTWLGSAAIARSASIGRAIMHSYIRPNTHVALRLPSGVLRILKIVPNTYVT